MNNFGAILRDLRLRSDKTLGQVARFLGISIPYLSDVERANRAPFTQERILQLAGYLGVEAQPLLVAAAQSRGAFELDAQRSSKHEEVGAMLMRGWTDLTPNDLEEIANVLKKRKGGPH